MQPDVYGMDPETFGAQEPEVEEPVSGAKSILLEFDVDEVAEPKALRPPELIKLMEKLGSARLAAYKIGCSEAFIRQNAKRTKL
ncbi:MAG: hypothetical protein H7061_01505 [Bdellovibrionaceae bacterium]|nr:hypothetical protein [Bdellovibrio sp.]